MAVLVGRGQARVSSVVPKEALAVFRQKVVQTGRFWGEIGGAVDFRMVALRRR